MVTPVSNQYICWMSVEGDSSEYVTRKNVEFDD